MPPGKRAENHGLFVDGELAVVVSLVNGVPEYWQAVVEGRAPSRPPADTARPRRSVALQTTETSLWLCTLATATKFRGRNLGQQAVAEALRHLRGREVYLDCKPGWLVEFYESLGFVTLEQKRMTLDHGPCGPIDAVLMKWGATSSSASPSSNTCRAVGLLKRKPQWRCGGRENQSCRNDSATVCPAKN